MHSTALLGIREREGKRKQRDREGNRERERQRGKQREKEKQSHKRNRDVHILFTSPSSYSSPHFLSPFPSPLQRYAELHDMRLIEASAKSNLNIQETFTSLAQAIIEERDARERDPTGGGKKTDSFHVGRGASNKKSSSGSEGGGRCKC